MILIALCILLQIIGIAVTIYGSRLLLSIVRKTDVKYSTGKFYWFTDFIDLSEAYIKLTGDRRRVRDTYLCVVCGPLLFVLPGMLVLEKLNLPR